MIVENELEKFPEDGQREKKWLSVKDAAKLVKFEQVKDYLLELEKMHQKGFNHL